MEASAKLTEKFGADCSYLHSCFSGNGTSRDSRNVAEIITHRKMEDIKLICQTYHVFYNQDLLNILSQKRDLLARIVFLRASEAYDRDAEMMRRALFGKKLDSSALTEIICTRTSLELRLSKQAYYSRYNSHVEQDVSSKINGNLQEALLAVLNSTSYYGRRVDTSMAMCDAKTLYEAVESGRYVDWQSIVSILSQRSTGQMKAILSAYKRLYGHEFMKFLKKDKCGEFGRQLCIVIRCIQFPEKQFAKQLRMALKNDDAHEVLVRTIVTRAGNDIKHINSAFAAKTGWSLESLVRTEFKNSSSTASATDHGLVGDILITILKHS